MEDAVPDGMKRVYCKSYRRRDGKVMVAAQYGKKAWVFDVPLTPANDNVVQADGREDATK